MQYPHPEPSKLQPVKVERLDKSTLPPDVTALLEPFNDTVDKLNRLLFTYLDDAVIAERL